MKTAIEMGDDERRALARKLNRCPVCGFRIQGSACPPFMCRALFVSLECTVELLVRAEEEESPR